MSLTKEYIGTLHVLECAECGMTFGITTDFESRRRKDHESFFCPSGHRQSYPQETEEERLRRHLDTARRRAASAEGVAEREKRRGAAARGQITKMKRRAAAGLCPCCNRTFQDLASHMATKHPEHAGGDR